MNIAHLLLPKGAYELYKWPTYLCWNHVPYQVHPCTHKSLFHCKQCLDVTAGMRR